MKKPIEFSGARPKAGDRRWYSIRAAERTDPAEVLIYDEIGVGWYGGGVSAEQFVNEVSDLKLSSGDPLRVRINSPGGDLFDGNTIYNWLRSSKLNVSVRIDGVAASAASIIAMAGDHISMPENSFMMIHSPWMIAAGNAETFRSTAATLDKLEGQVVKTYYARANKELLTEDDVARMLKADKGSGTWLTAEEATFYGFADEVDSPVKAAAFARLDLGVYSHIPDELERLRNAKAARAERRQRLESLKAAAQ